MAANLQQQRSINEQLRREADVPRIQVSQACQLMIKYVLEHGSDDCLLNGFVSQKVNPFREKNSCSIL
ncbi:guanine nucleotide-binding protein subunit gamma-1 [Anastrepha obliqua]|uniref:guanine nucleotide-binding protein subunit gamma-1 n=1 Tax=Anastrepha ludens TaxID=28586 RepID=UPI0023AF8BFC|nr:guanine nucleotide-binding protein subunit gamma-1 [Anastrepha ludens]XP_053964004.1 guanine nucleotide-binding protein subunit gamma-1 [Anastrepha ludens]XP_054739172.1 guanine nucleotide-binding protein subunit gamma-1 [Anastrepha obliqua]